MRTTTIGIEIYGVSRRADNWTEHVPFREYRSLAAVSSVDTLPDYIDHPGWSIDSSSGYERCKRVQIELPDDVRYGHWNYRNCCGHGLYAEAEAKDGHSLKVFARVNDLVIFDGREETDEAAIDRAIASGITLSVPRADGKRHDVPAKILEVSPPWGSLTPKQRAEWDDPRQNPQEDRK